MACPKVDFILMPAILIYFATLITELVSSVPVGLVQSDFNGHCILSAKVQYFMVNDSLRVNSFGSKSICEFCTYLTIFTTLFPLAYGGYTAYALYLSVENATQMWVLPAMLTNALLLVLKFISSCMLSVGVSQLCSSVTKSADKFKSCKAAQSATSWYTLPYEELDGGNFDTYLTTAQSASWFCSFEWLLLTALAFLHYRRNITLRSAGSSVPTEGGFGNSSSDTAGIITNEILPGTSSVVNPNYSGDVPPIHPFK